MRTIIISIIAFLGFLLSCFVIYEGNKKIVFTPSIQEPPSSPFTHFIAGQGIIESAYKNIPLGSSYSDIITDIYVQVGDHVKKGTPLFKTDTRKLESQLKEALAEIALTEEEYRNQKLQFSYYENLVDKNAVSKQAYTTAEYNKRIAYQKLKKAKASADVIKTDIQRSFVRAPIDGEILQLTIRIGQYAIQSSSNDSPLILFGDPDYFHVRIDIDEEDSWRYTKGEPAFAYVRGNKNIKIPLKYVYLEPYIIPKKSLTGSDAERVDTRVLQVVYQFKKNNLPVFIGEILDVYIQASSVQMPYDQAAL